MIRALGNAMGDVWITVRDVTIYGACFDNALVAEGWGRLHYVDNDELGTVVNNTNAWGFVASGDLTTVAGDMEDYQGHSRFLFRVDQDGNPTFVPLTQKVTLR